MAEELTCAQKFRLDLQRNWGQGDLYRDTPIRFLGEFSCFLLMFLRFRLARNMCWRLEHVVD